TSSSDRFSNSNASSGSCNTRYFARWMAFATISCACFSAAARRFSTSSSGSRGRDSATAWGALLLSGGRSPRRMVPANNSAPAVVSWAVIIDVASHPSDIGTGSPHRHEIVVIHQRVDEVLARPEGRVGGGGAAVLVRRRRRRLVHGVALRLLRQELGAHRLLL